MKFTQLILTVNVLIFMTCNICFSSSESAYSQSLSRMEDEWLHHNYNNESDITRISRLEEYVFGTIHDIDLKTRYKNLQKAFDIRKQKQYRNIRKNYNRFSGVPTSIPTNIEDLTD